MVLASKAWRQQEIKKHPERLYRVFDDLVVDAGIEPATPRV